MLYKSATSPSGANGQCWGAVDSATMSYAQPGGKRQKVREGRAGDGVDYFQGIEAVEYKNAASPTDSGCYRYYSGVERLHARAMEDWLKCSVALTDFRAPGGEGQARVPHGRPWEDSGSSLEGHKRCIKALFELCCKLGVRYWTAFDTDLVPAAEGEEGRAHWDELADYVQELTQRTHVKLLWIAPDLHSHPRYANGAFTSSDATVFVQAATQIKKCLEMSQRLNAECFLLRPCREGYDAIFQTDVAREIKLFSKLLKITAEYKDRLNYRCQLLIMPYYSYVQYHCNGSYGAAPWQHAGGRDSERVSTYMWDVTSCLYFLKNYNLDRYYKVCTPPGHHMYMANVYNMLGGVVITNQFDSSDSKNITLMMKCIVDQGTTPPGGIQLRLAARRDGDLRELLAGYVRYVDALARGLRLACSLASDQLLSKHVQQRYCTYFSGFGSRLAAGDVSMEECEEHHKKSPPHGEPPAGRTEHYNVVFQRYLDTCDHI